MEELLDCNQLNADCKRLLQMWHEYGHKSETLEKRKKTVNKFAMELFQEMVQEEEKRVAEKKLEVEKLEEDIKKLSKQLELQYEQKIGQNLLSTIEILEKFKQKLFKTKEEKMKDWMEAKKREEALCSELAEVPITDITDRIPTGAELLALNDNIRTLTGLKNTRISTFNELSDQVIKYLELFEMTPDICVEVDEVLRKKTRNLTAKFLEVAETRRNELKEEYSHLQSKWDATLNDVQGLWERLEINDRIDFGKEAKPSVFERLTSEHKKLLELKKANLKSFITKLRDEILAISQACFRSIILPTEEETDACLDEHEQLLKSLQNYKSAHQTVLDLIENRNDVFRKWKECEMRADDPSRFNNRGGNLLKEEKQRKALQKSLPKMEKEIEESGFMIWDTPVAEWLKQDWEQWTQFREEAKRKRKEDAAAADTNMMNTTRKRPATPQMGQSSVKRTRGTPLTPRKNVVLDPATTYTDFQVRPKPQTHFSNHNIFQSTMNKGEPRSPGRGISKSPIRNGDSKALKFTTPRNMKFNENF